MSDTTRKLALRYLSQGDYQSVERLGIAMQRGAKEREKNARLWSDLADNVRRLASTTMNDDPADFEVLLDEIEGATQQLEQEKQFIGSTLDRLYEVVRPFRAMLRML